jgi:glycosyltransferase involved in cell wall biosynthesis
VNADLTTRLYDYVSEARLHKKRKIGHWVWELPVFPAAWADAFSNVDEIWAPSQFVAACVGAATNKNVRVVPYSVSRSPLGRDVSRKYFGLPTDAPLVLVAFDFNSYMSRKNPLCAVRAFLDAFPDQRKDQPHLVLKCHGGGEGRDLLFREIMDRPNVHVIDRVIRDGEMNKLQSACDVYLSPHRSEGFGLNIAECMLLEKLVIATGFSATSEFMTPANSVLIPYSYVPVGAREYPHGAGQFWAEPSHEAIVEALRTYAFDSKKSAKLRMQAHSDIERCFSKQIIGELIVKAIRT